jgi:hypothetical protein
MSGSYTTYSIRINMLLSLYNLIRACAYVCVCVCVTDPLKNKISCKHQATASSRHETNVLLVNVGPCNLVWRSLPD